MRTNAKLIRGAPSPNLQVLPSMSARRHFPLYVIPIAKPRSIPPRQRAPRPDITRDPPARILIITRRPVPWRPLSAMPLQFLRPLSSNRAPAGVSPVVVLFRMLIAAPTHKLRPASVIHPDPSLVGTPRITFLARRTAPLLHKFNSAAHNYVPEVPPLIIRNAVEAGKAHAVSPNARPGQGSARPVSYNFPREIFWLTESFCSNFAVPRAIIRPVSSAITKFQLRFWQTCE
jgi:hypothetical protein